MILNQVPTPLQEEMNKRFPEPLKMKFQEVAKMAGHDYVSLLIRMMELGTEIRPNIWHVHQCLITDCSIQAIVNVKTMQWLFFHVGMQPLQKLIEEAQNG